MTPLELLVWVADYRRLHPEVESVGVRFSFSHGYMSEDNERRPNADIQMRISARRDDMRHTVTGTIQMRSLRNRTVHDVSSSVHHLRVRLDRACVGT